MPDRLNPRPPREGLRVLVYRTREVYPHARVYAGNRGTVTETGDGGVWVKLDNRHVGLDEWGNELHFSPEDGHGIAEVRHSRRVADNLTAQGQAAIAFNFYCGAAPEHGPSPRTITVDEAARVFEVPPEQLLPRERLARTLEATSEFRPR